MNLSETTINNLPNELLLIIIKYLGRDLSKDILFFVSNQFRKAIFSCNISKRTKKSAKYRKNKYLCSQATITGSLNILKWAIEHGYQFDELSIYIDAAQNNRLEILKYLGKRINIWSPYLCAHASLNGNLEVLMWFRENDCPWDWSTYAWAASNGHIKILNYALNYGCIWNKEVCQYAIENNYLEVFVWAKTMNLEWDKTICLLYARDYGRLKIFEWINNEN